jgi:hypothetical protein
MIYQYSVKYNDVVVKAHKARKRHFATFALPSYLLGVFMAAKLSTDRSPVVDYNISQFHDEKWL